MYRPTLNKRDRAGVIAAVAAIHAGLAFALLHMSGTIDVIPGQADIQIFDVKQAEPPPPVVVDVREKEPEKEGEASPPNIKSEATPVVRPKPRIELPAPPVIVASPTPNQGAAPTQGAAPVPGPGTGAGGVGNGLGAGGSGSGRGGGGNGLAAVRTRLATRPLIGRDFPPALLDAWPRGAMAFMRLRIDANGNIVQCIMDRGTGNRAMDDEICAIVRQRLRYRPALDSEGRPVADWAGYRQEPPH